MSEGRFKYLSGTPEEGKVPVKPVVCKDDKAGDPLAFSSSVAFWQSWADVLAEPDDEE